MIVIEVTNSREVVRQRVGRLGERLIGTVVDAEAQVEKALLQEDFNRTNLTDMSEYHLSAL